MAIKIVHGLLIVKNIVMIALDDFLSDMLCHPLQVSFTILHLSFSKATRTIPPATTWLTVRKPASTKLM